MPKATSNVTFEHYARALLDQAEARGLTQQIVQDVVHISEVIRQNPAVARFLSDPSISNRERDQLIDRVFAGKTSDLLVAYLKLVNAKGRLGEFTQIARAVQNLVDRRAGNLTVDVTVAQQLSDDAVEQVRRQLSEKLQKNVSVKQRIDESIIGGVILKIGDSLIDGSVKAQLEAMKRRLMAAV